MARNLPIFIGLLLMTALMSVQLCFAAPIVGFLTYGDSNNDVQQGQAAVGFSDIFWQSPEGGTITTASGSTRPFSKSAISKFIYLDESYYASMNSNAVLKAFRSGVEGREVVIPGGRTDIVSDADIRPFVDGSKAIGEILTADPGYTTVLNPIKAALDAEINHFEHGERKINNQWVSNQTAPPNGMSPSNNFNITTLDGKTYKNVNHIAVTSDSISFLYEDGGATINLAMLPPDLQKRFNYNPQAIADRESEAEKQKADAAAAAAHALDAQKALIESDLKNYEQLCQNSPPLNGQIFIVTKGGSNFKLGGVKVYLFTKSQIDFAINPKKQEAAQQLPVIVDQIKEAKRKYSVADADNANGDAVVENGIYYDAGKRMTELQNTILQLQTDAAIFTSADYYFAALPQYIAETSTDADGKFSFNVPPGRYVLAAKGSREILDGTEHYYWMVQFDMGNLARSIQLSNDNLTSANSDDSVVTTEDEDSSP